MKTFNKAWARRLLAWLIFNGVASLASGCRLSLPTPASTSDPTASAPLSWKDDGTPKLGILVSAFRKTLGTSETLQVFAAATSGDISMGFVILGPMASAPGTFTCGQGAAFGYPGFNIDAVSCTITVTQVGAVGGPHAVGTFTAIVYKLSGGTAAITDGRFDVPLESADVGAGVAADAGAGDAGSGGSLGGGSTAAPAGAMTIVFDDTTTVVVDSVTWDEYAANTPRLQAFKSGVALLTAWPMGIASGTQTLGPQGLYWIEQTPVVYTVAAAGAGSLTLQNDANVLSGSLSAVGAVFGGGTGPTSKVTATFSGVREAKK